MQKHIMAGLFSAAAQEAERYPPEAYVVDPAEARQIIWEMQRETTGSLERMTSVTYPRCCQEMASELFPCSIKILMSLKAYERRGKKFLIINDVPMTEEQYNWKTQITLRPPAIDHDIW